MWEIMRARIAWELGDIGLMLAFVVLMVIIFALWIAIWVLVNTIRIKYFGYEWYHDHWPGNGMILVSPKDRRHSKNRR